MSPPLHVFSFIAHRVQPSHCCRPIASILLSLLGRLRAPVAPQFKFEDGLPDNPIRINQALLYVDHGTLSSFSLYATDRLQHEHPYHSRY